MVEIFKNILPRFALGHVFCGSVLFVSMLTKNFKKLNSQFPTLLRFKRKTCYTREANDTPRLLFIPLYCLILVSAALLIAEFAVHHSMFREK